MRTANKVIEDWRKSQGDYQPPITEFQVEQLLILYGMEIVQTAAEKAYEWQDNSEECVHQILKLNNQICDNKK